MTTILILHNSKGELRKALVLAKVTLAVSQFVSIQGATYRVEETFYDNSFNTTSWVLKEIAQNILALDQYIVKDSN